MKTIIINKVLRKLFGCNPATPALENTSTSTSTSKETPEAHLLNVRIQEIKDVVSSSIIEFAKAHRIDLRINKHAYKYITNRVYTLTEKEIFDYFNASAAIILAFKDVNLSRDRTFVTVQNIIVKQDTKTMIEFKPYMKRSQKEMY